MELNALEKNVIFTGRLGFDELQYAYGHSDIFVLPSLWEGMPLTLLEAWAFGLPAIVTNVGNIPEICVDKQNAWVVEPGNETDLYDAMLALSQSPGLRHSLGKEGRLTVQDEFSWNSVAGATVEVYKSCINSPLISQGRDY